MSAPWIDELRSRPTIRPRRWAEISGNAPSSVYDQVARGDLPSVRLGGAIHIPTAPLLELLGVPSESDALVVAGVPRPGPMDDDATPQEGR